MGDTSVLYGTGDEEMKQPQLPHPRPLPHPRSVYFTTYDEEDTILRVISCPADHVKLQRLRPGESMLMGKADGVTQKVVNGKVVNKTKAEMDKVKEANPRLHFDTGE